MRKGRTNPIRPWSVWHSTELLKPFRIRDMYDIGVTVGRPSEASFVIFKRIPRSHSATDVQQFTSALPGLSRTFNEEQSGGSELTPGLVRAGEMTMSVIAAEEKQISSNRLVPAPCQGDA
jgi:hypothetical protein